MAEKNCYGVRETQTFIATFQPGTLFYGGTSIFEIINFQNRNLVTTVAMIAQTRPKEAGVDKFLVNHTIAT